MRGYSRSTVFLWMPIAEDGPGKAQARVFAGEARERRAAADLDVVAVRADAQHRRLRVDAGEIKIQHLRLPECRPR